MMSIGATTTHQSEHLLPDVGDDRVLDDLTQGIDDDLDLLSGELDLDEIMASAATAHARMTRSADTEHLSKIWRINLDTAQNAHSTLHCSTLNEHPLMVHPETT